MIANTHYRWMAVFLALTLQPTSAAEQDNRAALEINGCSSAEQGGTLVFSGCFELRQGSRLIKSTSATIVRDQDDQFQRVQLSGDPATWQETGDDGESFKARAERIDYDVQRQLINLTGDVRIEQGEREIASQTMRYDLRSGRVEGGDADDPDSRVRMRFPAPQPDDGASEDASSEQDPQG